MSDPLDKASAVAPPIIGSGCTQRYDPNAMDGATGTTFPDARQLWQRMHGGRPAGDANAHEGRPESPCGVGETHSAVRSEVTDGR
ncbi:hypothetical protein [Stutzerimonas chloritidismutans]|uniref:hypothetical protein n=1 Tax=Stutzerimonas chloritidismutans TaxID=203192 RepID=UPI003F174909